MTLTTNQLSTVILFFRTMLSSFQKLRPSDADVAKSLEVTVECYKLVEDFQATSIADTQNLSALLTLEELPEPVAFRVRWIWLRLKLL